MSTHGTLRADLDEVSYALTIIHGNSPGWVHICSVGTWANPHASNWTGEAFQDLGRAAAYVGRLDAAGAVGIYLRATTLKAPLTSGRGGAAEAYALPGMWADVDFGTVGHKPGTAADALPNPPDAASAWRIIHESGLPTPTMWVHSGGGLYPWHLLDQPHIINDLNAIAALSSDWQAVIGASATRYGWAYGQGVKDLARVLRVPGTVNRKDGQERRCRIVEASEIRYTLDELLGVAKVHKPAPAEHHGEAPERREFNHRIPTAQSGAGPFDVLAGIRSFDYLLEPEGWTFVGTDHGGELWLRPSGPDGPATSKYSARANIAGVPVLVVHSESAGLPSGAGQRLTPGRVFAHLHHRGDEHAAAQDLIKAAAGDPSASAAARRLPASVLAAIRAQCQVKPWTEPSPAARRPPANPASILTGLLRCVLEADEPDRESRLRWASGKAFGHVARGLFEAKTAASALLDAAVTAGLDEDVARGLITFAYRTGMRTPR